MDIDSWRGNGVPQWSGFIDLAASTNAVLSSPGSSGGLNGGVFFVGSDVDISNQANWNTLLTPAAIGVNTVTGNFVGAKVFEFYQFAQSAYQVTIEDGVKEATGEASKDLIIYSDYQPWNGEGRTNRQILMEDVSSFNFGYSGETIFIQVCQESKTPTGVYSLCKEKVIF